ncbi:MAG: UDP-3-O-(3-hydroxymyristoyl)glucosamine N-acyltransferase [Gemmatimonadales bacterium]|nr:UDP-3-O-(3-hydroxymyristoyl)glucosamine N-acyltransferase [Gemmatimonadales bacterium]
MVGGRLYGQGDLPLRRLRSLELAEADALAICLGPKYLPAMATTRAGAVLLPEALRDSAGPSTRIVVADPAQAVAEAARLLHPRAGSVPQIDVSARIGAGTTIGESPRIGAFVVVGANVTIGHRVRIGPHVVIEDGVILGDDVRLDAGVVVHAQAVLGDRVWCQTRSVIGSEGFGFHSDASGHRRSPQVGGCLLGDDVEVGAGSCIDRGSLDDTVIGRGTKLDNLVHVGHNARLGEHCLVMAGTGISGSVIIGDRVILAGQAGIAGHLAIGNDARVGAQAGVISSVPAGASVSGYPARPHREFLRAMAALYRLTPHVDALEALGRAEEQDDG